MSEILSIRLNNDPEESIPWIVWSPSQQEVIASGEVEDIIQLTPYSKEREVIVMADSSAISFASVPIPPGSGRQLENILPFLIEDDLVQDVSQVHVCLLEKIGDIAYVAMIEHKVMQTWISLFTKANLHPRRLIPDCLCLPLSGDGFTAVYLNGRWIVRTGQAQGFSAGSSWLPVMLNSYKNHDENIDVKVTSYSGEFENSNVEWNCEPPELVMELLVRGAKHNSFSLLTGHYKPNFQYVKYIRLWRDAVALTLILITIIAVEKVFDVHRIEGIAKEINTETFALARSVLPENNRIPTASYLRRLLETELSELSTKVTDVGLLNWLSEISPILKNAPGVSLDSLRFDKERGELRLNANGKDFSDFERLRGLFSEKFNTELGRLNRDGENVTGAFVLKKE